MTMGERIKQLRIKNDLTQEALGEKIGVKKAAIQKYECGTVSNLKRSKIKLLSEALGVTPAYMMGWDDFDKRSDTKVLSKEAGLFDEVKSAFGSDAVETLIGFIQLNSKGKEKALEYIRDLFDQSKYTE